MILRDLSYFFQSICLFILVRTSNYTNFTALATLKTIAYISAILLLCSCNNDQFDQCKKENEILLAEKAILDSTLNIVFSAYGEIDSTSKVIDAKKARINEIAKKGRLSAEDKVAILAEMDTINSLLESNKNKVSNLDGNLGGIGLEEGFRFMVQSMDEKNSSENDDLEEMKSNLAQISHDFSNLFEDYVYQEAENMEMRDQLSSTTKELEEAQQKLNKAKEELHSGWYVIGTRQELKSKGLMYKKGFFDNRDVDEDFDKNEFKKINIHELKELLLEARKAEIVTTHPSESYYIAGIKKKVNKLVISNPELFWSVSKFLIIEVEK